MVKQCQCHECGILIDATYHLNHFCYLCSKTFTFVSSKNRVSIRQGLQGDLTVGQWKFALSYFQEMCAYCQKRKWEILEHFIPATLGGSTTASNIVPACIFCNRRKYNFHPDQVTSIPREDMERVRIFLNRLKS